MNITTIAPITILAAALCGAQSAFATSTNAPAAAHTVPPADSPAAQHAAAVANPNPAATPATAAHATHHTATNHPAAAHRGVSRPHGADAQADYWPTHGKSRPTRHFISPYASGTTSSKSNDDGRFISVGVVLSCMALADGKASRTEAFLGNITELELDDSFLVMPELGIEFGDYFRLGVTYSVLKIGTKNWNNHLGDGAAKFSGPMIKGDFRFPMYDGQLIPHVGGGAVFYNGSFDEDESWKLGYSNYDTWAAYGFTSKSAFGKFRAIEVDNVVAPLITVGVAYRPTPAWEFDISGIYTFAEPECVFGYVNGQGVFGEVSRGSFDIGCYGATFSAAYRF